MLAILAVGFLVNDTLIDGETHNLLTRIDGLILILFFCIFVYYTFGIAKPDQNILEKTVSDMSDDVVAEVSKTRSVVLVLLGLVGLTLGGRWIVNGAIVIASYFDISEALIGLTMVAIGTSLPELATSVVAAKKGNADMAVGNVIGSNIFNLLWVLGLSSVISPIAFDTELNTDIGILILITVLLFFMIYYGKKNILAKMEGVVMVMLYVAYLVFLSLRG